MIQELVHAYTPLLVFPALGLGVSRFIPENFPKILGLFLYWVGVPLQIIVLAHQTKFAPEVKFIPLVAIAIMLFSSSLAILTWWGLQWFNSNKVIESSSSKRNLLNLSFLKVNFLKRSSLGSFILAAMLGNTGFIGLALTGVLTSPENNNWSVLYSVTSNVIGTYGIAVFIASYFGRSGVKSAWWQQLWDVITVPSLWAFVIGFNTRSIELPTLVESVLEKSVWLVIVSALFLVGLRLGTMRGWRSLRLGLIPSLLKVLIVPFLVGIIATSLGITGEHRLILVLMAGTPTGLSVLILAEVYELDRELLTSSIAMTFVGLLLVLPLWLFLFN